MRWVLCRRRDKNGNLVRVPTDLPPWVADHLDADGHWVIKDPQPFGATVKQIFSQHGLPQEEQRRAWQAWQKSNPGYGEGG